MSDVKSRYSAVAAGADASLARLHEVAPLVDGLNAAHVELAGRLGRLEPGVTAAETANDGDVDTEVSGRRSRTRNRLQISFTEKRHLNSLFCFIE